MPDITGVAFTARLDTSQTCAHETFPEVLAVEWIADMLSSGMATLGAMVAAGADLDMMAAAVEHGLIIAVAAGMAAGNAAAVRDLSSVDWDRLPDIYGD